MGGAIFASPFFVFLRGFFLGLRASQLESRRRRAQENSGAYEVLFNCIQR
jgi:hypothetical protein